MEFYYHDVDRDVLILCADGGLDAHNAEQFVGELRTLIDSGARKLLVDCTRLQFISSYGIGVLVRLHKRLAERGGHVKLASVGGRILRLLEISRLSRILEIYPSVDEARASFRAET